MDKFDANRRKLLALGGAALGAAILPVPAFATLSTPRPRILTLSNLNTGESIKAEFFDGTYDEFLEKIGWEDEEQVSTKKQTQNDYNENKKLRTKLIQERSAKLSPLKKKIETCEKNIMKLEDQLKADNDAIVASSLSNDIGELGRLGKAIKEAEEKLEVLYSDFESLHSEHDTLFLEYEEQLKNIIN